MERRHSAPLGRRAETPICSAGDVTCAAFQVEGAELAEKYLAEAEAQLEPFAERRRRLMACEKPSSKTSSEEKMEEHRATASAVRGKGGSGKYMVDDHQMGAVGDDHQLGAEHQMRNGGRTPTWEAAACGKYMRNDHIT